MIIEKIIYCIEEHTQNCYKFKVGEKFIFKIFTDSNYRAIHDSNNNFLIFFFDNQHYMTKIKQYFISEKQYRKLKLINLNKKICV